VACLDCGRPGHSHRCPTCARSHRGSTTERGYGAEWQRFARSVLDDWRATHGEWCPGWGVDGHEATLDNPLTVDHSVAMARGGARMPGIEGSGVMCRECNGRKAHR
jgi:5-methylcytosine-specific restriction enzyme A